MLVSPTREAEKEIRVSLLRAMRAFLIEYKKTQDKYWYDQMKELEQEANRYQERIKNHDYSEEDAMLKRVNDLIRKFTQIYETETR